MKKVLLIAIILVIGISTSLATKTYKAKKVITLEFTLEEGTNASAVVWNKDKQLYYAVFAGNQDYPLEVFSVGGEQLYGGKAGIDVRGLWYNAKSKRLEGNSAGNAGIFAIDLDRIGNPADAKVVIAGQIQPDFQSVGAFDSKKQIIYYYNTGEIYPYKLKSGKAIKSFKITDCPTDIENLNSTTVIYTDIKGSELGVLDYNSQKVYLFDLKGKFSATIELPSDATSNDFFCFSYANNKIWLYDIETRTWSGYSF